MHSVSQNTLQPGFSGLRQSAVSRTRLKKAQIWARPNCKKVVASGISPSSARLLKFLYDWVPGSPQAKLPTADQYYEIAVQRFADAATSWVDSHANEGHLSPSAFSRALAGVLALAWGYSAADSAYFTARFERSDRGCELHVLMGSKTPFAKCPSAKAYDKIIREISLGWPTSRPSHEKKGLFLVPRAQISMETHAGIMRAR